MHWTHYPIALPIDHEWEGSICTGSVFFHNGLYYAHYATRMPDRSERLGVAVSRDGIHCTVPRPSHTFAEPASPFLHGPNRDPFVFQEGAEFRMLVTAAVANKALPDGDEGALEQLVSKDLSTWTVLSQPLFVSGSDVQPECSDLFDWGDWYYLMFGLSGTTHYRMSRDPGRAGGEGHERGRVQGQSPDHRRLFNTRQPLWRRSRLSRAAPAKDGSLGTKLPEEMDHSAGESLTLADLHLDPAQTAGSAIALKGNARIAATITSPAGLSFAIRIGSPENEQVVFNAAAGSVTWMDASGRPTTTKLDQVADLTHPVAIVLTLHDTIADLSINNARTLEHDSYYRFSPQCGLSAHG